MTDDEALKVFVALGDSTRFEIFRKVLVAPGLSPSDLRGGKAPATISHHMKLLIEAGVVEVTKDGKHIQYNIHHGTLANFAEWAATQAELPTFDYLTKFIVDNPF